MYEEEKKDQESQVEKLESEAINLANDLAKKEKLGLLELGNILKELNDLLVGSIKEGKEYPSFRRYYMARLQGKIPYSTAKHALKIALDPDLQRMIQEKPEMTVREMMAHVYSRKDKKSSSQFKKNYILKKIDRYISSLDQIVEDLDDLDYDERDQIIEKLKNLLEKLDLPPLAQAS